MNRIETALQALQEKKEKAFITYITAGLPDYDKTKAIIKAQEAAGTDIIELGIPFSDPVADGPVIQAASYEAILGGANLEKTFICMKEMRDDGVQIPIVFMMYYNTVLHYGVEKFVKECNACAPDDKAVVSLPAFLAGQFLPQHLFPVLILPDFLLAVLNLGGQFLAGFLSRFRHGWSLLSACRRRKRTVDFSAALLGGY